MLAVYHVCKLQFQTLFHCYMIAHGITCRNRSLHITAIAYHDFYNNVNFACMCMHTRLFILCSVSYELSVGIYYCKIIGG